MGPPGLMVVEDCDRTVILAPAVMDAPFTEAAVPELVPLREAAASGEEPHSGNRSKAPGAPSEEAVSLGARGEEPTREREPQAQVAAGPSDAAVPAYAGSSPVSSLACRDCGDDPTGPAARAPPIPPAFLRGMTAPPKA